MNRYLAVASLAPRALIVGMGLTVLACNASKDLSSNTASSDGSSGGTKHDVERASGTGGDNSAAPSDNDKSTPPQIVTGAFLTSCGDAGTSGFGCLIRAAQTGLKIDPSIATLAVSVQYSGGKSKDTPTVRLAKTSTPWTFSFDIPADKLPQLQAIAVTGLINGMPIAQTATTFSAFSPADLLAAAASFGQTPQALDDQTIDLVFLTRATYLPGRTASPTVPNGFASVSDADKICANLAQAHLDPGKVRTWWAAVADRQSSVDGQQGRFKVVLPSAGIFYAVRATSGLDVSTKGNWGMDLLTLINTDENGAYVGVNATVWTGTAAGNTTGDTCSDWTSSTGVGTIGNAGSLTQWQTFGASQPCSVAQHLYCVGASRGT